MSRGPHPASDIGLLLAGPTLAGFEAEHYPREENPAAARRLRMCNPLCTLVRYSNQP